MSADHDEETIRTAAYYIWLAEGQPAGRHEMHWERARRELGDAPAAKARPTAARPRKAAVKSGAKPAAKAGAKTSAKAEAGAEKPARKPAAKAASARKTATIKATPKD